MEPTSTTGPLFALPLELFNNILSYLNVESLIELLFTWRAVRGSVQSHLDNRVAGMAFMDARMVITNLITVSGLISVSGTTIGRRSRWAAVLDVFLNMSHIKDLLQQEHHHRRILYYHMDPNRIDPNAPAAQWFWWTQFMRRWHSFDVDRDGWVQSIPQYCLNMTSMDMLELLDHLDGPYTGIADLAIQNQDQQMLRVLARYGWINMPRSINEAVHIALTIPSGLSIRVLRMVLSVTIPRRCVPMILHAMSPDPFVLCSHGDSTTAAYVLEILFDTLLQYGEQYLVYSIPRLKESFLLALSRAVERQDYGENPPLLVLEAWLKAHEMILVSPNVSSWKFAINLCDARLLRDILCIYIQGEWQLKIDLVQTRHCILYDDGWEDE